MEEEHERLLQWSVDKRPPTVEDMLGPESLKSKIRAAMTGKYHAILITGPTGCGKTTTARMLGYHLAKAEYGVSTPDYREENLGADGKIEDVRKLIESAKYLPSKKGAKKVFVLDECHKLSGAAADAFLKPLEEPPSHVVWILCTNEPEKLKPVMVGRCYPIRVDLADPVELGNYLLQVLKEENELRKWASEDRKALVKAVVQASGQIPRAALNILAAAVDEEANYKNVNDLIAGAVTNAPGMLIDQAANKIIMAMLLRYEFGDNKIKHILGSVVDHDPYALLRKLGFLSNALLLESASGVGQPGTYYFNKDAAEFLPTKGIEKVSVGAMGMIHKGIVAAMLQAKDFTVDPKLILVDALYKLHEDLKP